MPSMLCNTFSIMSVQTNGAAPSSSGLVTQQPEGATTDQQAAALAGQSPVVSCVALTTSRLLDCPIRGPPLLNMENLSGSSEADRLGGGGSTSPHEMKSLPGANNVNSPLACLVTPIRRVGLTLAGTQSGSLFNSNNNHPNRGKSIGAKFELKRRRSIEWRRRVV